VNSNEMVIISEDVWCRKMVSQRVTFGQGEAGVKDNKQTQKG